MARLNADPFTLRSQSPIMLGAHLSGAGVRSPLLAANCSFPSTISEMEHLAGY